MNSDIVLGAFVAIATALILIVTTLGCVLLTRFWVPKLSRRTRTLMAALGGPILFLLPLIVVWLLDETFADLGAVFTALIVALIALFIVAWLPARFATLRLDRLTQFDVETFS